MFRRGKERSARADRIIVGLGNPGPAYEGTRHNVGFAVVARLAADLGTPRPRGAHRALLWEVVDGGQTLVLAQPLTYMNRSGEAVAALVAHYEVSPEAVLVVYDDVNLPLGTMRMRPAGSAGGHNGMKSIIAALGTSSFPRLRIGIGPWTPEDGGDLADFVLAPFRRAERPLVDAAVAAGAEAARMWAREGVDRAMARFNSWRAQGAATGGPT